MIQMKRLTLLAGLAAIALSCRSAQTPPRSATDIGSPSRAPDLGAALYSGDRRPAEFPAAWPLKAGRRAVFGAHAMVASDAPLAGEAGIEIMRQGGRMMRRIWRILRICPANAAATSSPPISQSLLVS